MKVKTKQEQLKRRHLRLRNKVAGTSQRPRMSVHMSNSHIYVQFIDDDTGVTLASLCTLQKDLSESDTAEKAKSLGELAAKKLLEAGVDTVVFDRGGHAYKGRIKQIADAAREAGLKF